MQPDPTIMLDLIGLRPIEVAVSSEAVALWDEGILLVPQGVTDEQMTRLTDCILAVAVSRVRESLDDPLLGA